MSRFVPLLLLAWLCNGQEYEFPEKFVFGVATASYQIEGAWDAEGKGENIWDHITHFNPSYVENNDNGDVACNAYYKTEGDVQLLVDLGVDSYRFSISWSRILPYGHANYVNPDGIRYYQDLIEELEANGITPFVTMYHWDLPQPLQEIGGWPNRLTAELFVDYAEILFKNFPGVDNWITFNEPLVFCAQGYSYGTMAPGYTQNGIGGYMCAHTVLIAHANTYHLYNDKYKVRSEARVGITLDSGWYEPLTESEADAEAAETIIQMNLGWFAHPIFSEEGDYPPIMRERIDALSVAQGFTKSRLPEFTAEEVERIKGSSDFFGLNHYSTSMCTSATGLDGDTVAHYIDIGVACVQLDEWESSGSSWLKVVPWGFQNLLKWIKDEYNNPEVIVTENGVSDRTGEINDCRRVNYYNSYLEALLQAVNKDGCNISGYYAWSFMDNFEWRAGYSERFGIYYVDFNDPDRPRTPKMSSYVYKNIIETRKIDYSYTPENFVECETTER